MSSSFKWIYGQVINIRWKQENMAFVQKKEIPKSKLYEEKHFSFETFHLSKVKSTAELSLFLCFGSFALLNMHFHQLKCSNCNGFKEFNKSSVHWQRLKYNAIVPVTVCVRVCVLVNNNIKWMLSITMQCSWELLVSVCIQCCYALKAFLLDNHHVNVVKCIHKATSLVPLTALLNKITSQIIIHFSDSTQW